MNSRDGSRTAATSKMKRFVIIVNGWKPLTIITKHSNLDVATVLDPPLNRKAEMLKLYKRQVYRRHEKANITILKNKV